MARHLSNRHMVRKFLQLEDLLINIFAEIIHNDKWIGWALLHGTSQRIAVTCLGYVRCCETRAYSDFPVVLAVGALQTDFARLVPGLPGRDDNALNHNKFFHLV